MHARFEAAVAGQTRQAATKSALHDGVDVRVERTRVPMQVAAVAADEIEAQFVIETFLEVRL